MNAVVVYESLWGNTAAVAQAIAEGIGEGARALSTREASASELAACELLVAGAPTHMLRMPSAGSRDGARNGKYGETKEPPDVSHPPMRDWLPSMPKGEAACAAFETRLDMAAEAEKTPMMRMFVNMGARNGIAKGLRRKGYRAVAEPEGFIVEGQDGPLREGELERARAWGEQLRRKLG